MSHEATNWAIKQRGLKPTTKIVLWHLCDRFNPDYGCFPSQDRLAEDCEISRSTLNEHLGQLEAAGGNGGAKLGHGSGGIVSLRAE